MAASSFSRFLLTSKHTLTLVSRSYTSLASSSTSLSRSSILRYRPIVAVAAHFHRMSPATPIRTFATRPASAASDQNSNFSNKAPGETILLDGCDFEHWLVIMDKPDADATRDDIIDYYVKTMIEVVGSEEEARKKIYSVSTKHYFAFGANITEELSFKLKDIPGVRWVLPDSYLDVKNKDYGGEPFINGQAVPYDPKYHEEWVKNNARANERNKRSERPRNFDKSRNFDRRRENVHDNPANTDASQTPRSNVGGPTPYNQNLQQGGQPNYGGSPSYQPGVGPNQNSAGNPYQNQNVPGGDVPPPNLR